MDIRMCFVASSHDLLAHRVTTSRRRPLGAEMGRVMVLLTILATTTALRPGAPVFNRRAALTAAHIVHGHGLLEERELRPAVTRLARFVALARACRQLRPLDDRDDRLEELTAWFFLWRTLGR